MTRYCTILCLAVSLAAAHHAQSQNAWAKSINNGVESYNAGDFLVAINHFNTAKRLWPEDTTAYYYLGLTQFRLRDFDEAIDHFESYYRLGGINPRAYLMFINLLEGKHNYKRAKQIAMQGLKKFGTDDFRTELIVIARAAENGSQGDPSATDDDNNSVRSAGNNNKSKWRRAINNGTNFFNKSEFDLATVEFETAASLMPEDTTAYLYLGRTYARTKKVDQSLENYYKYMESGGSDPLVYAEVIQAESGLRKDMAKAAEVAEAAYEKFRSEYFQQRLSLIRKQASNNKESEKATSSAERKPRLEENSPPVPKESSTAVAENTVRPVESPAKPKNLFPQLKITDLEFTDKSANNALDANEEATIKFKIANVGNGKADSLRIQLQEQNKISGVTFDRYKFISSILPGRDTLVQLSVKTDKKLVDGRSKFQILVREARGFDSEPFLVEVPTNAYKFPKLEIAEHSFFSDNGGNFRLGSPVKLKVVIKNSGIGTASNLNASFKLPENVFPVSADQFEVEQVPGSASTTFQFEFIANKRYVGDSIPITINIAHVDGQLTRKFVVGLSEELQSTAIVLKEKETETASRGTGSTETTNLAQEEAKLGALELQLLGSLKQTKYYALVIGIDNYQDPKINDLTNPIKDATKLMEVLKERYVFQPENVVMLKDPTRAEILDELDDLARKVTERDNLLIFYAGHGIWDEQIRQGYWLPSDSRKDSKSAWLSNGTIVDNIRGINSKHTLLISDACFSGGIFRTRSVFNSADMAALMLYKYRSRKAMTSGTLTTVPDESAFMKYLIKRLEENDNIIMSAEELFITFRKAVINNSIINAQIPQFGDINNAGDEGGDFIFLRKY